MPSTKISGFTQKNSLQDTMYFVIALSGQNYKISGETMKKIIEYAATAKFYLQRNNGSEGSETAILANDEIAHIIAEGYDGDSIETGAYINFEASENWSNAQRGTSMQFFVVKDGETSPTKIFEIKSDGTVEVNGNDIGVEFGNFLGSGIDGSRQITLTHSLGRNVYNVDLLDNNNDSIDRSNYFFENTDTSNVKLTCNFPYESGDTIDYKLS